MRRRGHFLTLRDRQIILQGPEPRRKTKLDYRGDRITRERRAFKAAHARAVREALRDARGALEDLAFLAGHMKAEWLYDLVTQKRPLYPLSPEGERSLEARQLVDLLGFPYAPLETFLRHVLAKLGWHPWAEEGPQNPNLEGSPPVRRPTGGFVAVRLAAAMEKGLNEKSPEPPTHLVQIVSREDPQGVMQVWGYPEPKRPLTRPGRPRLPPTKTEDMKD